MLEGSSECLWDSSWVVGRVLGVAQAVPGTYAVDLKNSEQTVVFFFVPGILALWGALCAIELRLGSGRMLG